MHETIQLKGSIFASLIARKSDRSCPIWNASFSRVALSNFVSRNFSQSSITLELAIVCYLLMGPFKDEFWILCSALWSLVDEWTMTSSVLISDPNYSVMTHVDALCISINRQ